MRGMERTAAGPAAARRGAARLAQNVQTHCQQPVVDHHPLQCIPMHCSGAAESCPPETGTSAVAKSRRGRSAGRSASSIHSVARSELGAVSHHTCSEGQEE